MALDLLARLGFDTKGFSAGLNSVIGQAKGAGAKISGFFSKPFVGGFAGGLAGYLGFDSLKALGDKVIHRATEIKDFSEQLGISTEEVQRLENAASQAGLGFEQFSLALKTVGEARKNAAEGNEQLRETFRRYGITLEDLQNPTLRDIDLLQRLGRALAGVTISAAQRADLRDLLGGRGGDRLAAVFDKLADKHFTPMRQEDIEQLDAGAKALERLGKNVVSLAATPAGKLAMILTGVERPRKQEAKEIFLTPPGTEQSPALLYPGAADKQLVEYGEEIGKLRESALRLEFERLKPAAQLVELEREILELQKERAALPRESPESARLGTQINEKRIQLLGLQKQNQPVTVQMDDLARIGGLGFGAAPPADWQIRLVNASERTAQNTEPEQ